MTAQLIEPEAVRVLRDIIEGDDPTMMQALVRGRALLALAPVVAARPLDDVDRIMGLVADDFGLTVPALLEDKRTHARVVPRQVAMWLCRTITRQTFEDIGRRFAGRHHGTVLCAMAAVKGYLDTDPRFKARLGRLLDQAKVLCGPVLACSPAGVCPQSSPVIRGEIEAKGGTP